ncbi:MAG: hypothetical protein IPI44_22135 [Sulfuritalea sp.]|nr:hypothetical protein [Sulfuritalea sp.]
MVMAEITARWEWRSFGDRFGTAERNGCAAGAQWRQESDEIYLLSRVGDNVKVRDALMDIKVLREVNADGLEQWTPVMEGRLPASGSRGGEGARCAQLPIPTPLRAGYTQDEFIGQFAAGRGNPRGEGA